MHGRPLVGGRLLAAVAAAELGTLASLGQGPQHRGRGLELGCLQLLHGVAAAMEVKALSPGDPVLECGEYGDALKIVLTGTVEVVQRD